jgi:hypothetical protein
MRGYANLIPKQSQWDERVGIIMVAFSREDVKVKREQSAV